MTSTIPTSPSFSILSFNPTITNTPSQFPPNLPLRHRRLTVRAHSSNSPVLHHLKNIAGAAVFTAATVAAALTFSSSPARAEPPPTLTEVLNETRTQTETDAVLADTGIESDALLADTDTGTETDAILADSNTRTTSPLYDESSSPEALKSLLQQKLELGEDEEALKILKLLISSQPEITDWKFTAARLTTEIGDTDSARTFYEEILKSNPLSFEALFENALLMDSCGEGEAVIERLEDAMRVAVEDSKEKEARDVKLIMAQILFLQKNVDEALGIYEVLIKEDPNDFRPYFCRGMIYTLLDKNDEAKEQFAKYRELSPKKFEVDGYLRTPLSKIKQNQADHKSLTNSSVLTNNNNSTDSYFGVREFDSDVVMILAVLLCAFISSLALNSIIRCALRFSNIAINNNQASQQLANKGIKKKALKTFPTVNYSTELKLPNLDTECMICLSEFAKGEKVRILPKCNHGFHVRCIDKWLKEHSSCPKCRQCLHQTYRKVGESQVQPIVLPVPEITIRIQPLDHEAVERNYRVERR